MIKIQNRKALCKYITEINLHLEQEYVRKHFFPSQFTKISSRCSLISRAAYAVAIHIIHIHRFSLHSASCSFLSFFYVKAFFFFFLSFFFFFLRKNRLGTLIDLCQDSLCYRSFMLLSLRNINIHSVLPVNKNSCSNHFHGIHLVPLPETSNPSFLSANC